MAKQTRCNQITNLQEAVTMSTAQRNGAVQSFGRLTELKWAALLWVLLHANAAFAQSAVDQGSFAADTSSPRATLKSFLDACNEVHDVIQRELYFDRSEQRNLAVIHQILDCLDASELPAFARTERAGEVAVCLKEILDRHEIPPWNDIPDVAAIDAAGGFEKLSMWRVPGTRITITRVEEGPQKHEYLFSVGTVDRAADYYKSVEKKPYRTGGPTISPGLYRWYISAPGDPNVARIVNRLPDQMRFGRTFGMANWKWPGLFLALIVAMLLMGLFYYLNSVSVRKFREKRPGLYGLTIVFPMAAMAVPMLFEHFAYYYLTVRANPLYILSFCSYAIAICSGVFIAFGLCNRMAEAVIASPRINPHGLNAQLVRISSKILSVVLATVVMLVGGQFLGIPVATLLASAGIGGVALALGAQDALKTLFATIMLMADKPYRVGERIIYGQYDGEVEDIGLRSTQIRLFTGHQVSIPNNEMARSDIENVGRRKHIRRVVDIHIPLDTSTDDVEAAVEILRSQLNNHEGMHPDYPPRVFFFDFLPDAFTIRVYYWYHPPHFWDYMAFSEKFNFAISREFEARGIRFSLPFRVTHTSTNSQPTPLEVCLSDTNQNVPDHFGDSTEQDLN